MKSHQTKVSRRIVALLICLSVILATGIARAQSDAAGDNAELVSSSFESGKQVMPRSTFIVTWTFKNTGTTTWGATRDGTTLNLLGWDRLGAVPLLTNSDYTLRGLAACINSGQSVAPKAETTYSMSFIAPENSGSITDYFQLNGASSEYFGPTVSVSVVVMQAGSTNQYDRARAVSYANNYDGYVCSDGYFWTNSSGFGYYGPHGTIPTLSGDQVGDDCAHFCSSCIGSQTGTNRGGGLYVYTRDVTYGEPGAGHLLYTCLVDAGIAVEVSSLTNMEPGDLIGWNWEGITNTDNPDVDIDHVTMYLGNSLVASHAVSALDVDMSFFETPPYAYHLIHILDAPTMTSRFVKNNLILSWGTNWATYGYNLYSSTNMAASGSWTKMSKSPTKVGQVLVMSNTVSPGSMFYRLTTP